jgi:hypothetical protein
MFLISGVALLTPKIEVLGYQFFISLPLLLLHLIVVAVLLTIRGNLVFYKLRHGLQYYLFFFMWSLFVILATSFRVGSFHIMPFLYLAQHVLFSIYIFMVIYNAASNNFSIESLVERYIKYIFILMGASILLWLIENYTFLLSGSLDFLHMGVGNKFSAYTDTLIGVSGQISIINPNQLALGSILSMFVLISYELSKYKYLAIFFLGLILTFSAGATMIVIVSFFMRSLYSRYFLISVILKILFFILLTLLIVNLDRDSLGSVSKFFIYLAKWVQTGIAPDTFGERIYIFQLLLSDIGRHPENLLIGAGYSTDLGNYYRAFTLPNESDILDILFHTGLIGLLLIIFFYTGVFRKLFFLGNSSGYINLVSKAIALFLPALFIANLLAGGILRSVVFSPILFVLLGLIFAANDCCQIKKINET